MFLTTPTIEELQHLDMSTLMDMLAYQTKLHFTLLKTDGVNNTAQICRDSIINIQLAIEFKRKGESNTTDTGMDTSYIQDTTQ